MSNINKFLKGKLDKNESGQIMTFVLILLVVGSILISPALIYASTSLISVRETRERANQLYAADAGIEDALFKLKYQFNSTYVPKVEGASGPLYNLAQINNENTTVTIQNIIYSDTNKTYLITSTATDNSTATTIRVYTSKLPRFFTKAVTTGGEIWEPSGSATVIGDIEEGYDTTQWPFLDTFLKSLYFGQVSPPAYTDNTLDISTWPEPEIGPLLAIPAVPGELKIQSSTTGASTHLGSFGTPAPMDGTIYVQNGNLEIGGAKEFTLDMNNNTIYVEGNVVVGGLVSIIGSGCIIAQGTIDFAPNLIVSDPRNFIFLMSLSDADPSVKVRPYGNFYGAVAGRADIQLQPGYVLQLTPPPQYINFPTDDAISDVTWLIRNWRVNRGNELTIINEALPGGDVGAFYSQTLNAILGTTPYTWSISAGLLPPDLLLDPATGIISGTPTTEGTFNFTVQVTDSVGATATKALSITIENIPPSITTTSLPDGFENTSYTQPLILSGGASPYIWSISTGSLPTGLSLDSATGVISGIPTSAGPFSFTVMVTDAASNTDDQLLTITIIDSVDMAPTISVPGGDFTSPNSVFSQNGIYATASKNKTQQYSTFGFGIIPGGATIKGIKVKTYGKTSDATKNSQIEASLSWNGGTTFTAVLPTAVFGNTDGEQNVGGPTDTWGKAGGWSPAELNDASFRLKLTHIAGSGNPTLSLDYVHIIVYYTSP